MNSVKFTRQANYHAVIKGVRVYVDYINERSVIMDYEGISDDTVKYVVDFSGKEGLGKVICNCRRELRSTFERCNFTVEGMIKGYFSGDDAYCASFFLDPERRVAPKKEVEDSILYQCFDTQKRFFVLGGGNYTIRQACIRDVPQMIKLFSIVFETYPSPVFSSEYLKKVMNDHIHFKVAEIDGQIISIASADMDRRYLNAEMTDCATHPDYRGRGIIKNLISSLEAYLKENGFVTAYSLSRAINPGINKVFGRMKYEYGGRLVNNCHICGGYEDMNIWVKNFKHNKTEVLK